MGFRVDCFKFHSNGVSCDLGLPAFLRLFPKGKLLELSASRIHFLSLSSKAKLRREERAKGRVPLGTHALLLKSHAPSVGRFALALGRHNASLRDWPDFQPEVAGPNSRSSLFSTHAPAIVTRLAGNQVIRRVVRFLSPDGALFFEPNLDRARIYQSS